jgi:choline dehydrogenase-like flavoprotein
MTAAGILPGRYDYVIVGAGSAGCVLANRLSADPTASVLLLEAGGSDAHPYLRAPAGFLKTFQDPRFNWCYGTQPGPGVDGRSIFFPRGKVLGGSSSINGHLYVRGQARDFDTWAQMGNRGWSYGEVLPYFRRSEDRPGGDPAWRGAGGPLHVSDIHERHPICEAFIAGAASLGLPRNPDYNGAAQEGVAYYQRTIRNGRRHSAATGFLRPAMRRPNLRVETGAHALGLDCEGRRVVGVTFRQRGVVWSVRAGAEVLLSAGAIGSPHLLQLSGIGPAGHLRAIGVEPVHDLSGVGEGLRDHYAMRVVRRVTRPVTLNERARPPRLWWEVVAWLAAGRGLLAFSPCACRRLPPLPSGTGGTGSAGRVHAGQLRRGRGDRQAGVPAGHDLRRVADAPGERRPCARPLARPGDGAGDPAELFDGGGGSPGRGGRPALGAPAACDRGAGPWSGPETLPGEGCRMSGRCSPMHAREARRSTTPSAPAAWAWIRSPWSVPI